MRRRTILAPMRPRPIIPSCISKDSFHQGIELRQAGGHIGAEVNPQSAATLVGEYLEVAAGLRGFHHAEGILLAGHIEIDGVVTGDLEEDTAVRSAFVSLSGGVEEARSEAEAGGYMQ